jgi:hypothetical protein
VTPLYPQKLALTSAISGDDSVGTVRSRTEATELVYDECRKSPEQFVYSILVHKKLTSDFSVFYLSIYYFQFNILNSARSLRTLEK